MRSESSISPHPLVAGRDLGERTRALRLRGDALSALINLQSSAEILLRGVYRMLLVDEGRTSEQVDQAMETVALRTLLRTRLPNALGGDWTSATSPITTFVRDLYQPRNRMVHAGREPGWQEIQPAFDAYEVLVNFLGTRIQANWKEHPRTLAAWCDPWTGGPEPESAAVAAALERVRKVDERYWLPRC